VREQKGIRLRAVLAVGILSLTAAVWLASPPAPVVPVTIGGVSWINSWNETAVDRNVSARGYFFPTVNVTRWEPHVGGGYNFSGAYGPGSNLSVFLKWTPRAETGHAQNGSPQYAVLSIVSVSVQRPFVVLGWELPGFASTPPNLGDLVVTFRLPIVSGNYLLSFNISWELQPWPGLPP